MATFNFTRSLHHLMVGRNSSTAGISPDAYQYLPQNFLLNTLHGTIIHLSHRMGSVTITLPLFMVASGVPTSLIGLILPISMVGGWLPQLAVAGWLRPFPQRKWVWVGSGVLRILAYLIMILAALVLPPLYVGIVVILMVGLSGVAGSIGSLSFLDLVAKTIPRGQRGTLLAWRAVTGGTLTLFFGLWLQEIHGNSAALYRAMLAGAAFFMLLATAILALIREENGGGAARNSLWQEAQQGWRLMQRNTAFKKFLVGRSLLLSIELSLPFYTLASDQFIEHGTQTLGLLVLAISLAEILSNLLWGWVAARSSRWVMMGAAALASVAGIIVLLSIALPPDWRTSLLFTVIFMAVGFAETGVRLGSETYLIDGASDIDRPRYVAVSNTLLGILSLFASSLGVIAAVFGLNVLITLLVVFALGGLVMSYWLPEVLEG